MATKPFVLPSGIDFYAGDGTAAGAADPLLVVSDSTNKVGINSQTPSGTLDINTASATDKGLIVRGVSSQSSSLVEAQNSSSGILAYVGPSGVIGGSGININPYTTVASGLPTFRTALGGSTWPDQYGRILRPKIGVYGSIAAQGVQLANDSIIQLAVSGYTTGSLTGIYYYRITPIGPNGEENPYSPGYATTAITSIPSGTPSGVVFTWTNPTTNYIPVAKWRIYRGTANQSYGAGTAGAATPFTLSSAEYTATTQGTSVYFDTVDGTVSSFTDSGNAGTVGFPPDHFRGIDGWLAANRGLYTPELFTCIAQGGYSIARAVNVNGIIFTNASIDGGNSNAKTMQMPSLAMQITDPTALFSISNTTLTNASFQVSVSATNGGYLILNDSYGMKSRLGPHITNTLSDNSTASGIAYYFNTSSTLTDPRKLMSVRNADIERFVISAYGTTTHTLGNATAKGVVITAAASQSANLLEIQRSNNSTMLVLDSAGELGIGSGVTPVAMIDASGSSTSTVVQINRAASGQTANIYEVRDNVGNILVGIDKYGRVSQRLYASGAELINNTAFGYNALASLTPSSTWNRNTAIGYAAGQNIINGGFNVLIGLNAGYLYELGNNNVVIGTRAMQYASGIAEAVAIGDTALQYGGGNYSTAIGTYSLQSASGAATFTTAIGYRAGTSITTGDHNTLVGSFSSNSITTGSKNTIITSEGSQSLTTGSFNTILGGIAASTLASGNSNTLIGYAVNVGSSNVNNSIAIGASATANQNNQLVIGSSATKIGKSDGTGEQTVSLTAPSGVSKLLEVSINGSIYNIPLLPSGATNLAATVVTPPIITSTGLTLTNSHNGYIIEQTGVVSSGTFTIGDNTQITIPGWNCMIVNIGSGVIVSSGTNTMRSPGGLNKSRTQYSSISIYRRGTNDFMLGGDLA